MMKSFFRYILIGVAAVFLILQAVPKGKNQSNNQTNHLSKGYTIPENVAKILDKSCNDCHSNSTNYSWYAAIQPARMLIDNHVEEGKKELNFSEFMTYNLRRQYHKLEEIIEQVETDEMPLKLHSLAHPEAKLNAEQKKLLIAWAKAVQDTLKAHYPMDSLLRKKK